MANSRAGVRIRLVCGRRSWIRNGKQQALDPLESSVSHAQPAGDPASGLVLFVHGRGGLAERLDSVKHKMATTTFAALSGTEPAKAASPIQTPGTRWPINGYASRDSDNLILKWDEKLLQAIRLHPRQTGPTVAARALTMLHTATYDAWAAYDPVAVPNKATRYFSGTATPITPPAP